MIHCLKTNFYANQETIDCLLECHRVSAGVWNHCLKFSKETHVETSK